MLFSFVFFSIFFCVLFLWNRNVNFSLERLNFWEFFFHFNACLRIARRLLIKETLEIKRFCIKSSLQCKSNLKISFTTKLYKVATTDCRTTRLLPYKFFCFSYLKLFILLININSVFRHQAAAICTEWGRNSTRPRPVIPLIPLTSQNP